tara:strand:+ start:4771 stop:5412 length:642 start_codon:yes stop_codon:yes gene_type:complete
MDGKVAIEYILKNNIEGHLVECGVDSARQEVIWIEVLKKYNVKKHIYMFDTFAGLTKPTEHDYMCDNYNGSINMKQQFSGKGKLLEIWEKNIIDDKTNNWCYTPLNVVQNKLNSTGYDSNYLHYICGDILETLKDDKNIPKQIALLRLDTDWYESTKIELEVLFNKVIPRGLVVFDDYFLWNGQRKAVDDYLKQNNLQYTINKIDEQRAYIIK